MEIKPKYKIRVSIEIEIDDMWTQKEAEDDVYETLSSIDWNATLSIDSVKEVQ